MSNLHSEDTSSLDPEAPNATDKLTAQDNGADHVEADNTPFISGQYDFGAPGDVSASHGGAGAVEMRDAIRLLREAGIPSCVVGVHALRYYGAFRVPRVRGRICVSEWPLNLQRDSIGSSAFPRISWTGPCRSSTQSHIRHCTSHGQTTQLKTRR